MKSLILVLVALSAFHQPADALLGNLISGATNLVNNVVITASNVGGTIANGASNLAGTVVNTVSGVANNVINTATNVGGSIVNGATNLATGVVNGVSNTVDTVTSTVNTVQFIGQFLWDNAFNPALEVLGTNTAIFVDQYFGNVLNAVGKRDLQSDKEYFKTLVSTQIKLLINDLKTIYFKLLSEFKDEVKNSFQEIASNKKTMSEIFKKLATKAFAEAKLVIQQTIQAISTPSRSAGFEFLSNQIGSNINNIGDLFNATLNVITSTLVNSIMG